jgi:hypothetical protein
MMILATRWTLSRIILVVCAETLGGVCDIPQSIAQVTAADPGHALAIFDIPTQPLASALDSFTTLSGDEVFYDGSVSAGRLSKAVKGSYRAADALQILLTGTGLLALPSTQNGFTLVVTPEESARIAAVARIAADRRYGHYFALVQNGIREILCERAATQPGSHRLILRFWIEPSGAIYRAELKGSTGDAARDALFTATLQGVTFEEPPPVTMPQPITMAIFSSPAVSVACQGAGEGARH